MFVRALVEAKPGDEVIYCIGEYAHGPHRRDALEAAQFGLCLLYQRRIGPLFAYIARKIAVKP